MSPYEFTSKTHSLSTEDLGKIFIDSFIDSLIHLSTPREPFTLNRKTPVKWRKITGKLVKNKWKIVLLTIAMWSWRGCVQGSGSMFKYRNYLKNGQIIKKKYAETKSDFYCWHNIEQAVLMVQGPYLNIEHSPKMAKTWENNKKKCK